MTACSQPSPSQWHCICIAPDDIAIPCSLTSLYESLSPNSPLSESLNRTFYTSAQSRKDARIHSFNSVHPTQYIPSPRFQPNLPSLSRPCPAPANTRQPNWTYVRDFHPISRVFVFVHPTNPSLVSHLHFQPSLNRDTQKIICTPNLATQHITYTTYSIPEERIHLWTNYLPTVAVDILRTYIHAHTSYKRTLL